MMIVKQGWVESKAISWLLVWKITVNDVDGC